MSLMLMRGYCRTKGIFLSNIWTKNEKEIDNMDLKNVIFFSGSKPYLSSMNNKSLHMYSVLSLPAYESTSLSSPFFFGEI